MKDPREVIIRPVITNSYDQMEGNTLPSKRWPRRPTS